MGATARKTTGSPVRVHSFVDLTQEDSEEAGTPECTSAPREVETARKTVVTPPNRPDPTQATSSAPPSRAGGSASTAPDGAAPASGAGASAEEKTSPTGSSNPLSSALDRQVSNSPPPLSFWTLCLLWGQHPAGL